jgi:hypothetical protein
MRAVQALELAAFIALLGMAAVLLQGRLARLHASSPAAFQMAGGVAIGLSAAIIVLVLQTDLVPDAFEAVTRPILIAIVGLGIAIVAVRVVRS